MKFDVNSDGFRQLDEHWKVLKIAQVTELTLKSRHRVLFVKPDASVATNVIT